MTTLGTLVKLDDLRSVWKSEAQHFTPWLAQEKNLAELGKTIGMELELVAQEHSVGIFKADLLCKDTLTQQYIIIENQLERTDHSHLGQILTYAAGVSAKAIVWVATSFTDEHRAALDWMNEITAADYGFFGLEIELWKIGTSDPAPKFNVISRPNDWRKTEQEKTFLSGNALLYQRYWTGLRDFFSENRKRTVLRPQKPLPNHWINFAIGRTGFLLCAVASIDKQRISVEVNIYPRDMNPKAAFATLQDNKDEIEKELGFSAPRCFTWVG
ncbi:MAG: DUF4268 domain-containing protein [Magnetococcales bacterium]|nr:DUF4268 domain-containing protein [Magnetococcales bacterium]